MSGSIYTPTVGLRNHQFEDVEDICDLTRERRKNLAARRIKADGI